MLDAVALATVAAAGLRNLQTASKGCILGCVSICASRSFGWARHGQSGFCCHFERLVNGTVTVRSRRRRQEVD